MRMDWILNKLETFGSRIACLENDERIDYAAINIRVSKARRTLQDEQKRSSSVIAIQTTSVTDGIAALIAIACEKKIALPLPTHLSAEETKFQLEATGCETTIQSNEKHEFSVETSRPQRTTNTPALVNRFTSNQNASGLILFSSGTSAEPKAMLHNFDALLNRYNKLNQRSDRSLLLLLIDHIGGLDSAFRTLLSGSTLIIPKERTPDAVGRAIATHRATILPASPTFLNLMLMAHTSEHYDCSSLEIIAYGAEPMPEPLLSRLNSTFPRIDLQQKFGTSETGAIRIKSSGSDSLFFKIADRDTQTKILDGELWLKTPSRIIGYLNADESSLEANGWYRTGDLVEEGPNETIRIIGRESAIINVGGQKVHPSEIEAIITNLPEVRGCHVFAEIDPITGSRIACEIVTDTEDTKELRDWKRLIRNHCRGKLAPWKIPSKLTLTGTLHMNERLKADLKSKNK